MLGSPSRGNWWDGAPAPPRPGLPMCPPAILPGGGRQLGTPLWGWGLALPAVGAVWNVPWVLLGASSSTLEDPHRPQSAGLLTVGCTVCPPPPATLSLPQDVPSHKHRKGRAVLAVLSTSPGSQPAPPPSPHGAGGCAFGPH